MVPFLAGQRIAVSISESPGLGARGLSRQHQRDAMVEIARHLLASGAHLVYGGDLRRDGFTSLLFELVARYRQNAAHIDKLGALPTVINLLAWPVHATLTREQIQRQQAELGEAGAVLCLTIDGRIMSADLSATMSPVDKKDIGPEDWHKGLTAMRRTATEMSHARFLLGGRLRDYSGVMPGIAEEALLTIRANKPVFLAGGYGGCAHELAVTIGIITGELRQTSPALEYDFLKPFRAFRGVDLSNRLTGAENERLATTVHADEIALFLLRGLRRQTPDKLHAESENL
ncbi:MAG TPA: hypothetical protein VNV25_02230 [Gemmatimonadaceae bacterium]|jgi:hypothetical protein|nr:hypothetical protein [Gemmatimonadaceae bacterium]